mmetsp:Transcript_9101/g.30001  ORF Transcript_9101/g.30001 Transcript_9101/m.30001 type:complete len:243 (-) Transcript_9101:6-734(-)
MFLFLGRRRDDVLGQLLVLHHTIRQRVATIVASALVVVRPQRGGRTSGEITTNDELDGENLASFHNRHVWIRRRHHCVWHNVLRLLKPPLRCLVQHRTFEWNVRQMSIKRALSIGRHRDHVLAFDVRVANFALVLLPETQIALRHARVNRIHRLRLAHGIVLGRLCRAPRASNVTCARKRARSCAIRAHHSATVTLERSHVYDRAMDDADEIRSCAKSSKFLSRALTILRAARAVNVRRCGD